MEAINGIVQIFAGLNETVQVGVIMVLLVALVSGGGLWQALRRRNRAREREFRRPPLVVRLAESDRELFRRGLDAIDKHADEVRRHGEQLPRGPARTRSPRK